MRTVTRNSLILALLAALASPLALQAADRTAPEPPRPIAQGGPGNMTPQMQAYMQRRFQSMQARMQTMQNMHDPQAMMPMMHAQMQDMQAMMHDFNTACPMGGPGGPGMMGGPGMGGQMPGQMMAPNNR